MAAGQNTGKLKNLRKLKRLLKLVPEDRRTVAEKLITELAFMEATLDGLRRHIEENGAIDHFKQGQQEFDRESPAVKTYSSPALRLRVPDKEFSFVDGHMGECVENLERDCGDFLLRRSDGMFAYQLAVVVDDAAMGVTEVVRGADLLSSTPRQLYLYQLLGLTPPEFFHFPLLLAPDGRRLSKRDADAGLDSLRGRVSAEELLGRLARLAGFHPSGEPSPAAGLLEEFSWEMVPQEDIRLPEKLFE